MSAKQHVGCASNCDQHHAGDAYCFVMYPPIEADAGAEETGRYEPHKDVEDLGRHRQSPHGR
jgi:hypothetical protein